MQNNEGAVCVRKDSWSTEEDKMLVETVLSYVKQKKRQVDAFVEVGEKLKRTKSATAFRWNNRLRKDYEKELKSALGKASRKAKIDKVEVAHSKEKEIKAAAVVAKDVEKRSVTIDDLISYLQLIKEEKNNENEVSGEAYYEIQEEKNEVELRLKELEKRYMSLYEDYEVIMSFAEKVKTLDKKEAPVSIG